ncbi:MAG: formylglycine-generating enzyme family protein [Spirochaetaceae bacterium]|nr:formylglycine-generating enzyme family protein [Spirochaetaceae bacterium]
MKRTIFYVLCFLLLKTILIIGCNKKTTVVDTSDFIKIELKNKTFDMGSYDDNAFYDEMKLHKVTFTYDILMCNHEVTQKEWLMIFNSNPSLFISEVAYGEVQENRPVESINWYSTIAYCNKRSLMEGLEPCYTVEGVNFSTLKYEDVPTSYDNKWNLVTCDFTKNGYRLPTEAEWEYAARGGIHAVEEEVWPGTVNFDELKNYVWDTDNSRDKTHEVKMKQPNGYGLYDMGGNVWEWCWDWYFPWYTSKEYAKGYDDYYVSPPEIDPTGPSTGDCRVIRGGSWNNFPRYCRATCLYYYRPSFRFGSLGFRVVRSVTDMSLAE